MKSQKSNYSVGPILSTLAVISALATFDAFAKPRNQSTAQDASETARKIRAELTSDEKLSTYAKNVKVIVIEHLITLEGPVTSDAEKIEIVRTASKVAPAYKIVNQLQVVR